MSTLITATPATTTTTTSASPVDVAIAYARAQIGKPYRWGAAGPDAFDCSGLVTAAYKAAGVDLPRTTAQLITVGTAVAKDQLAPGDLVFPTFGHVQLYTGAGNVVEAPKAGENVVERAMWGFLTARRVVQSGVTQANVQIPVVGPALDLANKLTSAALNTAGDVLGLGDLATNLGQIALRIAFVVAGAGLVILGAARMVGPSAARAAAPVTQMLGGSQ